METAIIIFFILLSIAIAPLALMMAFMAMVMLVGFIRMPFEYMKMKRDETK